MCSLLKTGPFHLFPSPHRVISLICFRSLSLALHSFPPFSHNHRRPPRIDRAFFLVVGSTLAPFPSLVSVFPKRSFALRYSSSDFPLLGRPRRFTGQGGSSRYPPFFFITQDEFPGSFEFLGSSCSVPFPSPSPSLPELYFYDFSQRRHLCPRDLAPTVCPSLARFFSYPL